jgi:hypothetical protein
LVMVLLGVIFRLWTRPGMVVLDMNQPGAEVKAQAKNEPTMRIPIIMPTKGTIKGVVKYKGAALEPKAIEAIKRHKDAFLCMMSKDPIDWVRSAWHREFSGETWRFCGSRVSTSGLILQKRNLSWQIENDQTFCLQERIPYGEVYSNGWSHRK